MGVQPYARSINSADISHMKDQDRSLRSSRFIARVAPIMPIQFQTSQSFCGVARQSDLLMVANTSERTFQLGRISWMNHNKFVSGREDVSGLGSAKFWMARTKVQVLPNPYDQRPRRRVLHRFRIFTNRSPRVRPRKPSLNPKIPLVDPESGQRMQGQRLTRIISLALEDL